MFDKIVADLDILRARLQPRPLPAFKPKAWVRDIFNMRTEDVDAIAALGVFNGAAYQHSDWNGGTPEAGLAWVRKVGDAGLDMGIFPGSSAPGDLDSNLLQLARNSKVRNWEIPDEPDTQDGPGGTARMSPDPTQAHIARTDRILAAAGLPGRPTFQTVPGHNVIYGGATARARWNIPGIGGNRENTYAPDLGVTQLKGRADWGDTFTSTEQGAIMKSALHGPLRTTDGISAPTLAMHVPFMPYILLCADSDDASKVYSPAQIKRIIGSAMVWGACGYAAFDTILGKRFVTAGVLEHPELVPTLQELKRRDEIMQAAGFLMSANGGRTPGDVYESAVADMSGGSDQGPPDVGAIWHSPAEGQMPGGWEVRRCWNDARTDSALFVSNLQIETRAFSVFGIGGTVAPGDHVLIHDGRDLFA